MVIQSENVWINERFSPAALWVEDGKIKEIMPYGSTKADVDYGKSRIFPGFIDIHSHGYQGANANRMSVEGLLRWVHDLPDEGVTSFLFTTSTAPVREL